MGSYRQTRIRAHRIAKLKESIFRQRQAEKTGKVVAAAIGRAVGSEHRLIERELVESGERAVLMPDGCAVESPAESNDRTLPLAPFGMGDEPALLLGDGEALLTPRLI